MPGLLLCFVLRYDAHKKTQINSAETGLPPPSAYVQRVTYFHCSLIGYFLGECIHVCIRMSACGCTMTVDKLVMFLCSFDDIVYISLLIVMPVVLFTGCTICFISGLLTATVSSEVFKAAQPALLYLVPFTLLPLLTMAYLKVVI